MHNLLSQHLLLNVMGFHLVNVIVSHISVDLTSYDLLKCLSRSHICFFILMTFSLTILLSSHLKFGKITVNSVKNFMMRIPQAIQGLQAECKHFAPYIKIILETCMKKLVHGYILEKYKKMYEPF